MRTLGGKPLRFSPWGADSPPIDLILSLSITEEAALSWLNEHGRPVCSANGCDAPATVIAFCAHESLSLRSGQVGLLTGCDEHSGSVYALSAKGDA